MKHNTRITVSNPKAEKEVEECIIMTGKVLNVKDIAIGGVLVLSGLGFMLYRAFINGGDAFRVGEDIALAKIDCIH